MATITVTPIKTFVSGETVTPAKLNQLSQSTVALTAATIVAADIASNAVTTAKILNDNVTNAKLASGIDASKLTTGTLPIARIANETIDTAKLADNAVTDAKLSLAANAGEIKKALNADNPPPIFACRSWVNFDGTRDSGGDSNTSNTDRFIRASGNVSSVTKTGTGAYTINFTTAFPSGTDDYCVQVTTQNTVSGAALTRFVSSSNTQYSFVATDAGGTATNSLAHLNVAIFR
jgi:hypothetical protein